MKGIKLSNKNLAKLRVQCTENYSSSDSVRVKLGEEVVSEIELPEYVKQRIGV